MPRTASSSKKKASSRNALPPRAEEVNPSLSQGKDEDDQPPRQSDPSSQEDGNDSQGQVNRQYAEGHPSQEEQGEVNEEPELAHQREDAGRDAIALNLEESEEEEGDESEDDNTTSLLLKLMLKEKLAALKSKRARKLKTKKGKSKTSALPRSAGDEAVREILSAASDIQGEKRLLSSADLPHRKRRAVDGREGEDPTPEDSLQHMVAEEPFTDDLSFLDDPDMAANPPSNPESRFSTPFLEKLQEGTKTGKITFPKYVLVTFWRKKNTGLRAFAPYSTRTDGAPSSADKLPKPLECFGCTNRIKILSMWKDALLFGQSAAGDNAKPLSEAEAHLVEHAVSRYGDSLAKVESVALEKYPDAPGLLSGVFTQLYDLETIHSIVFRNQWHIDFNPDIFKKAKKRLKKVHDDLTLATNEVVNGPLPLGTPRFCPIHGINGDHDAQSCPILLPFSRDGTATLNWRVVFKRLQDPKHWVEAGEKDILLGAKEFKAFPAYRENRPNGPPASNANPQGRRGAPSGGPRGSNSGGYSDGTRGQSRGGYSSNTLADSPQKKVSGRPAQ